MGRKKLPFYRIVAIDSRCRRDGRPLEARRGCAQAFARARVGRRVLPPGDGACALPGVLLLLPWAPANFRRPRPHAPQYLGWYNPMSKEVSLAKEGIQRWLERGAEPSDTVAALLRKQLVLKD